MPAVVNYAIKFHQSYVQSEIQQQQNLYKIEISKQTWARVKRISADEIELNGKLFDIQSIHISTGKVIITGCFDKTEDKLIAVSKGFEKKEQNIEKQVSFFNILFCEEQIDYNFFNSSLKGEFIICHSNHISTSFLQEDSPPPKA